MPTQDGDKVGNRPVALWTERSVVYTPINATTVGNNTLAAAVAGQKIHILELILTGTADANTAILQDGAAGTELARFRMNDGSIIHLIFPDERPMILSTNTLLNLNMTVNGVSGLLVHYTAA